MKNYEEILADLRKTYGNRVREIRSVDGVPSFIVKGVPEIIAVKEPRTDLGIDGAESTCTVVIQAQDLRFTVPTANTQLGGIAKRTLAGLSLDGLNKTEIAKATTYVVVPKKVATNKTGKEVLSLWKGTEKELLEMLRSESGTELKDRAFARVESFDMNLILSPSQQRQVSILLGELRLAKDPIAREKINVALQSIISSITKKAYVRTRDANGRVVRDTESAPVNVLANRLVVDKASGELVATPSPVFTQDILLGGLTDTTSDGTEIDAFYVHRIVATKDASNQTVVKWLKGGISEESQALNNLIDGIEESHETSIPVNNVVANKETVSQPETVVE